MSHVNEATWDRTLRLALGITMLWVGWAGLLPHPWAEALLLFAFAPLLTGILGWCPLYALLRFQTNGRKRRPAER